MLETLKNPDEKKTNIKAKSSLLLGIISIIGIFLVGYSPAGVGLAGLLLGTLSLREIKKLREKGIKLAVVGIIFSCLGIVSAIIYHQM